MNPIYKFELSNDGATFRRVYPIYKDDLAKEYKLQQNEEFYRADLSGKLTFVNADYDFINLSTFESQFELHVSISYDAGQTWALYWVGRFWKTDCEFDYDDKTIIVQPEVYDEYNDVLAGMDKEYNLIELLPEIEQIELDKRPMIQIYSPGEEVIACFLSGMYWEQDCEAVTNESDLTSKYYFAKCASRRVIDLSGNTTPALPAMFNGAVPGSIQSPMEFTSGDYKFTFQYIGSSGGSAMYWRIYRVSDNLEMWNYGRINQIPPTAPYTVTLQPVPGTGATGTVELYVHDINVYGRYITNVLNIGQLSTYPIPADDLVENNRNYSRVIGYAFDDVIYFSDRMTNTPTQWGLYQPGQYYQQPAAAIFLTLFPVAKSAWSRLSIWFAFSSLDWLVEQQARQTYTLKDAYPLASVISVLLAKIAPGITHEATTDYSQFLYGTNPISATNYRLFLTQKSNILAGNYDQPAQKAPATLKQITDMLRDCFRCYWFIDNGKFRIEHIQYFRKGGTYTGQPVVGIDLTQQEVTRNGKKWAFATSNYSYDKPGMPERYQFGWMDDVSRPFEGYPIDILSKYVKAGNIEEINISNFTSDVDYMLLNPGACSEDGFALLAPVFANGVYKLPYYQSGESVLQNGYMAFDYLQQYYLYDLPANRAEINGRNVYVLGIKKLKNQTLKFPVLTDPDLTQLIKTNMGNGTIEKISINLSSRNANATLKYDTE